MAIHGRVIRTAVLGGLLAGPVGLACLTVGGSGAVAVAHGGLASSARVDGVVSVESNSSRPDANQVLAFRYRGGVLSRHGVRRYATGGSGSHDLSNSGVLDSDQELIVNPKRTLLFAVNSGSDTIAIFHIEKDGGLRAAAGSPFPSHGKAPASLGLAGDTLIVANKAQDGVRNLTHVRPNYTSFHVRPGGSLSAPISTVSVRPGSSPLQAYVTPDHKVMISSEETGVFRAFRIGPGGRLSQGPTPRCGCPTPPLPTGGGARRCGPRVWSRIPHSRSCTPSWLTSRGRSSTAGTTGPGSRSCGRCPTRTHSCPAGPISTLPAPGCTRAMPAVTA